MSLLVCHDRLRHTSPVARYGYARISTRSQRDDAQLDALREAGCDRVWTDTASGRLARRPEWDNCLDHLRAGDELVITRLSRMARSVRHLTETAAHLVERGIDLIVLKQGIDTSTPAGRFTFHVLAAMDEMLADLISEGTKEGLASARARGRTGGRPPRLSVTQVNVAQDMYDELGQDGKRRYTVDQIAETLGVSRKTIYRRLSKNGSRRQPDKTVRTSPAAARSQTVQSTTDSGSAAVTEAHPHSRQRQRSPEPPTTTVTSCPGCGHQPGSRDEARQQHADLDIVWLHQQTSSCPVNEHRHCANCQPHGDCAIVECARCGDGPILTGHLAERVRRPGPRQLPAVLRTWLADHGWQTMPELLCPEHR